MGAQSTVPSRSSALMLPNNLQLRAMPTLSRRVQNIYMSLQYVTTLSIDSELIENGSAINASEQVQFVPMTQQALANTMQA